MKKQIRNKVFETNSSSCHSLSINTNVTPYLSPHLKSAISKADNMLHIRFGEFGWGYDEYTNPYDKLQYALTMVLETEGRTADDFYETEGFKAINELIKNFLSCDGIAIDSEITQKTYYHHKWDDKNMEYIEDRSRPPYTWLESDGYIDHQSHEDYDNLNDFLFDYSVSLFDFIFNPGIKLIIDNDNH